MGPVDEAKLGALPHPEGECSSYFRSCSTLTFLSLCLTAILNAFRWFVRSVDPLLQVSPVSAARCFMSRCGVCVCVCVCVLCYAMWWCVLLCFVCVFTYARCFCVCMRAQTLQANPTWFYAAFCLNLGRFVFLCVLRCLVLFCLNVGRFVFLCVLRCLVLFRLYDELA
jgi:hypothetical protein